MKSRKEVLLENYEYYVEDPSRRAIGEHGGCEYINKDCKRCSVGRSMIDPPSPGSKEATFFAGDFEDLDERLQEEYRGLGERFWMDLQSWHDTHSNWNKEGLTESGQEHFDHLMEVYNADV